MTMITIMVIVVVLVDGGVGGNGGVGGTAGVEEMVVTKIRGVGRAGEEEKLLSILLQLLLPLPTTTARR